jgi:hypothetical protein
MSQRPETHDSVKAKRALGLHLGLGPHAGRRQLTGERDRQATSARILACNTGSVGDPVRGSPRLSSKEAQTLRRNALVGLTFALGASGWQRVSQLH